MRIVLLLLLLATTNAWASPRGVDLASLEGWDIVIPQDAIPSEVYAAEEFRDHYQRASGFTLPIVDATDRKGRHVFIGAGDNMRASNVGFSVDDSAPESLRIVLREDAIAIAGGRPRGTLYGVYTFLERFLGVRFLAPEHTHVPVLKAGHVVEPADISYAPPLDYRYCDDAGPEFDPAFAVRARLNHHNFGEKYGGSSGVTLVNHTFYEVMPTSKYGREHPEYYSLIDGKRVSEVEVEWYQTQLCLTNPDVLQIITDDLLDKLRADPGLKSVSVGQNDSLIEAPNYCQCPNCQALNEREGTPMGSMLYFVNAVADKIAQEFPNVTVGTLAYHHTVKAPRTMKPRPNVRIQLCTIEGCVLHPINDPDCPNNAVFEQVYTEWREICDDISVWDYNMSFLDYRVPCPRLGTIAPNIRHFVEDGATGVFMEGVPYHTAALSDLRAYVTANLLWDPDQDTEQLTREFVALHYGAAAPAVLQYIQLIGGAAQGRHASCFGNAADYGSDEAIARAGLDAFDEAIRLAENDEVRRRVEKASICAYRAAIEPLWYVEDEAGVEKFDLDLVARLRPLAVRFFELCEQYEDEKPSGNKFEEDYYLSKDRLTKLYGL